MSPSGPLDHLQTLRHGRSALVATLLHDAMVRTLRAVSVDDRKTGLSRERLTLLWLIATDGPIAATKLAAIEDLKLHAVHHALRFLKEEGYVVAGRSSRSAENHYTATSVGRELLERAKRRRLGQMLKRLDTLTEDELQVVENACHLLRRDALPVPPSEPTG